MSAELPSPKPAQPYVYVSVLESGRISLPEAIVVEGGSPTEINVVPSMAFVLRHSTTGKRIVFDLGVRKDWDKYPSPIVQMIKAEFHVDIPVDVADSLRRGGMQPHDVDTIIFSHLHFDHVGDPGLFPTARFVVHQRSRQLLVGGNSPEETDPSQHPEDRKNFLPESRTTYVADDSWTPLGPFPRAHDFFGDGSVYLVDAPGHCPGHINALVRTSADGAWLYLAGDSAHDARLITGEKEIGMFPNPEGGMMSVHTDLSQAKAHVERIRKVKALPRVHVLLSHDLVWFKENQDKGVIFPGEIPPL